MGRSAAAKLATLSALGYAAFFFGVYRPGRDGTYAQNFQDVWVQSLAAANDWTAFSAVDADAPFYVDVGAYHPTECSNSALLDLQMGWRGLCVEPFPVASFAGVGRNCKVVERAMSDKADKAVSFCARGAEDSQAKTMASEDRGNGPTGGSDGDCPEAEKLKTTTINFKELLLRNSAPTFINAISLDVEGLELTALKGFPFATHRVGCWIIEINQDAPKAAAINKLLSSKGYRRIPVANAGVDEYYVGQHVTVDEAVLNKAMRVHPRFSNGC